MARYVKVLFLFAVIALPPHCELLFASHEDPNAEITAFHTRIAELARNGPIDEYETTIIDLVQQRNSDGAFTIPREDQFALCHTTFKYFLERSEFRRAYNMLSIWKNIVGFLSSPMEEFSQDAYMLAVNYINLGKQMLESNTLVLALSGDMVAEYALDIKSSDGAYYFSNELNFGVLERLIPIYHMVGNNQKSLDYAYMVMDNTADSAHYASRMLNILPQIQANNTNDEYLEFFMEFAPSFSGTVAQTAQLLIQLNTFARPVLSSLSLAYIRAVAEISAELADKFTATDIEGAWLHTAKSESLLNVAIKTDNKEDSAQLCQAMSTYLEPYTDNASLLSTYLQAMSKSIELNCQLDDIEGAGNIASRLIAKLYTLQGSVLKSDEIDVARAISILSLTSQAQNRHAKSLIIFLNMINVRAFSLYSRLHALCAAAEVSFYLGRIEQARPLLLKLYQKITDPRVSLSPTERIFLGGRLINSLIGSNQLEICYALIPDLLRNAVQQGIALKAEHLLYLDESLQYVCERLSRRLLTK